MAVKKQATAIVPATKQEQIHFEHGKLMYELGFWTGKAELIRAEIEAAEPGSETTFIISWLANVEARIISIKQDLERVTALLKM